MALIDSVVSAWHLDEASGDAIDAHASNDGTVTGATQGVIGKFNDAYNFEASNDEIALPNLGAGVSGSSARSISFWVKGNSDATIQTFISWGANPQATGEDFIIYRNGSNSNDVYVSFVNSDVRTTIGGHISESVFTHVVITFAGGTINTTNLKIYINGSTVATTQVGSSITAATENANYRMGIYEASANRDLNAIMDEVIVFNIDIGQSGVNELYNSGAGLAYPFAAGTLRLIKISGTFQAKPILTKVAGSFVDKPIKIKVGGTFQDA